MRLWDTVLHFMGTTSRPIGEWYQLEMSAGCASSALNAAIDATPLPHLGVGKINVYCYAEPDAPELSAGLANHVSSVMSVRIFFDVNRLVRLAPHEQVAHLFRLHTQAVMRLHEHHAWSTAEIAKAASKAEENGLRATYRCSKQSRNRQFTATIVGRVDPECTSVVFDLTSNQTGEVVARESRIIKGDYWELKDFAKAIRWNGLHANVVSSPKSINHPANWSLSV